jgi:hypothetical protein
MYSIWGTLFVGYFLPQFSGEDLVVQKVGIDIEDMHMQRILILMIFEKITGCLT